MGDLVSWAPNQPGIGRILNVFVSLLVAPAVLLFSTGPLIRAVVEGRDVDPVPLIGAGLITFLFATGRGLATMWPAPGRNRLSFDFFALAFLVAVAYMTAVPTFRASDWTVVAGAVIFLGPILQDLLTPAPAPKRGWAFRKNLGLSRRGEASGV